MLITQNSIQKIRIWDVPVSQKSNLNSYEVNNGDFYSSANVLLNMHVYHEMINLMNINDCWKFC